MVMTILEKKSEWTKDNGTSSGLTNEMINSGIGKIVLDGDYNTTYTILAKDCDEYEARLVIEDQAKFDGKYADYYLIQEVLGCNMLTAKLIIQFYEEDVLDYWFDTLSDDDFMSRYFNEFNSEDEIEEGIDYLSYNNKFYTLC